MLTISHSRLLLIYNSSTTYRLEFIIVPPKLNPLSNTQDNLEWAFAGESMAHIKYLYFAKRAREAGAVDIAEIFEKTAANEVQRAFAHLDLLYPRAQTPPTRSLEIAIADETQEYAEIYPQFRSLASKEGHFAAMADFDEQIAESRQHAQDFREMLEAHARRYAALVKRQRQSQPPAQARNGSADLTAAA